MDRRGQSVLAMLRLHVRLSHARMRHFRMHRGVRRGLLMHHHHMLLGRHVRHGLHVHLHWWGGQHVCLLPEHVRPRAQLKRATVHPPLPWGARCTTTVPLAEAGGVGVGHARQGRGGMLRAMQALLMMRVTVTGRLKTQY